MFAAAAYAPYVVVEAAGAAACVNFGGQGFVVKEDFTAGYFGIPNASVGGECAEFTDAGFDAFGNRAFGIEFVHGNIVVAVEFAGFQVDVGFDLGHQFPVFIKFGAQPEFGVEIGIGSVGRGIGAAVVGIDVFGVGTDAECSVYGQQIVENADFIFVFADDAARIDVIARRCQCGGIALYASGFCKCGG